MYLTLTEWADATRGEILAGSPDQPVGGEGPGGLAIDSRTISNGQWFVALRGATGRDGHAFIEHAIESGTSGLIISNRELYESTIKDKYPKLPVLLVTDTTAALGDAARTLLDKFNPFVIAITGTVGKTSVKEYVTHIAESRWRVLKNPHNWNTEIGLPLTVFELTPEHRMAILECASRGPGQIKYLSRVSRPHVAVITSIGPGHLSEFGSIDDVAHAKWEIVDGIRENGTVIALGESPYTNEFGELYNTITFGMTDTNHIYPLEVSKEPGATQCTFVTPTGTIESTIPGTSQADLLNAVCAVAIAIHIKIEGPSGTESLELDEISESLKTLPTTQGRMETVVRPSGIEVIYDAYNSNPVSLWNALEAVAERQTLVDGSSVRRRIAILGDMLELGEYDKKYHLEAGEHAAGLPVDCILTVGDLASLIAMQAVKTRKENLITQHFNTTKECASELPNLLKPGDLVLIKASRAFEFEKLLETEW